MKKTEFFGLEEEEEEEEEEKKEMDGSMPSGDPRQREKSKRRNLRLNMVGPIDIHCTDNLNKHQMF